MIIVPNSARVAIRQSFEIGRTYWLWFASLIVTLRTSPSDPGCVSTTMAFFHNDRGAGLFFILVSNNKT